MEGNKVATFQERFSELINSSTKSRTAIASEFGVAKQTISAWTTGQSSPRLPVVSSLADYFGVSCQWLLGFDVPKYHRPTMNLSLFGGEDKSPRTPEARIIASGVDKLPHERRQQALRILQVTFTDYPDYFKEDPDA